ncbi:MAG TPA: hypothetical protein EYN67_10290 [Flavobacteriales bacterium]|nr:hypothetical protein [Methylococcaceae bacterium]HHZ95921.1 hypothetical protein [Flavobacteriales bacterium]
MEQIKDQLATLSSYEPQDIDNPEFEVMYEDVDGFEHWSTVCCVDLAGEALRLVKHLEDKIEQLKG